MSNVWSCVAVRPVASQAKHLTLEEQEVEKFSFVVVVWVVLSIMHMNTLYCRNTEGWIDELDE